MSSTTKVMDSAGATQTLAAPFESPNFATCFGAYQSAAAAPATAHVQPVTLSAPTGVKVYGYVTTFTLADQTTASVGNAFIIGGRTASVLQPSAAGPTIPAADFSPAYVAVVGRVARATG